MDKNKKLASGFLRITSAVIDIMVWLLVFLLVLLMISTAISSYNLLDSFLYALIITTVITSFGAPLINSFLISRFGGGFGKLLTGTRIVREDKGTNLDFKTAFLRNHIGYTVSGLIFGLGFIWLFVDDKKQTWHDMLVKSLVVVKSKQAYLMAFVSVILLLAVNVFVINKIYINVVKNQELYVGIYEDVRVEIERIKEQEISVPTDELDLKDIGLLH